jgi:hypothetical protein
MMALIPKLKETGCYFIWSLFRKTAIEIMPEQMYETTMNNKYSQTRIIIIFMGATSNTFKNIQL